MTPATRDAASLCSPSATAGVDAAFGDVIEQFECGPS
jgi:hypothetical protein